MWQRDSADDSADILTCLARISFFERSGATHFTSPLNPCRSLTLLFGCAYESGIQFRVLLKPSRIPVDDHYKGKHKRPSLLKIQAVWFIEVRLPKTGMSYRPYLALCLAFSRCPYCSSMVLLGQKISENVPNPFCGMRTALPFFCLGTNPDLNR